MRKSVITICTVILFTMSTNAQEISAPGVLGAGIQATSLNYGISARYNLTEVHGLQAVIGSVNYGFGGSVSAFSFTGRYLYSFTDVGSSNLRPYALGQLGIWTVKYKDNFWGTYANESDSSIAYGIGAGIEYAFDGLEQLGFNIEAGYGGGSFGDGLSYSGVFFGGGVHYYFNL
ncbi:outer membrane protein [Flagellimonas hadalis]|uniref:Outer membrane protein beta-barrel domain-containing protein n=1 Tax=Flagellimonas hadalis TaxID=2597517 RepID=A0A5N5IXH3_9FLAO|nr:hypothetical protein [Allomuricauda hadalis]KAB5491407.1 hypothetical protein FOT42_000210 [Allomuricauda hadalis]